MGFYYSFRDAVRVFWPLWWTCDPDIRYLIQMHNTASLLWKRYKSIIMQPINPQSGEHVKIIWVCWLQGEDKAPEIVKACIASIRKWAPDYELRLLNEKNILDYATLPAYIVEKYQKGKIRFAHFSDILRTCLLYEHGGIWIDATVLLTDGLPEEITQEPFFVYRNRLFTQGVSDMSSWLIAADRNHPILKITRDVLFAYWKKENILLDYFMYHLIMTLVVRNNPTCKQLFDAVPIIYNVDAPTMLTKIFQLWNNKDWNVITKRNSVHKLTYKLDKEKLQNIAETNYEYIMNL